MADTNSKEIQMGREQLARWIVPIVGLGVIILAIIIVVFSKSEERANAAQIVLTGILPLLASWVGTILAFYFSKENFDAATRSVTELSKVTSQAPLQTIAVKDKMLRIDPNVSRDKNPVYFLTNSKDDCGKKLEEVLVDLKKAAKGDRIPILDANDHHPMGVIHKSAIDAYLLSDEGKPPDQATLGKLLQDKKDNMQTSFAIVSEDDNLASAKAAMEATNQLGGWGCQDVFVTPTGKRKERVVGWITNAIIQQNSTV
jgi:hypothetical protein